MPAASLSLEDAPAATTAAGALRLVSVLFPEARSERRGDYARMAGALERSAAACSPDTPLELRRMDHAAPLAGGLDPKRQGLVDNWHKMVAWDEIIQAAHPGETVGLLDCDTMVIGDLSPVLDLSFDVAYTVRPHWARFPFNSGVVFARVSARVWDFFRRWREVQRYLLLNPKVHEPLRRVYGGLNQAALGELLTRGVRGLELLELPCPQWNCEDTSWHVWSAATKIVHVKSRLRRACLGYEEPGDLAPLVELWRRYAD